MKGVVEVVGAIIRANGRFLVGQRPTGKTQAGFWEFIGGKLEPGETPEQALVRECREEVGLEIENLEPFGSVTHAYPEKTVHLTLLSCTPVSGSSPLALEHQAIRWIAPEEMRLLPFCPADTELIDRILSKT